MQHDHATVEWVRVDQPEAVRVEAPRPRPSFQPKINDNVGATGYGASGTAANFDGRNPHGDKAR
jgi:hypothetical protein